MKPPVVQGWCPGALRPMQSGDGLVVRIRPFGGSLSQEQANGVAALASEYGNGLIDVSNRANMQVRGVRIETHLPLIDGLRALGLIDETEAQERQRNVMIAPFWLPGDDTDRIAQSLTALLVDNEIALPAKFGFAVDSGPAPILQNAPADIRIERSKAGLLICAEGSDFGKPVTSETAALEAFQLGCWFAKTRGDHRRMRHLTAAGIALPPGYDTPRDVADFAAKPGHTETGVLVGLAFGQMTAETLSSLAEFGALRLTPWRMLLVEGLSGIPQVSGILTDADDPLLRVLACTGAPGCSQALGPTRHLAKELSGLVPSGHVLHVSGCAKHCAHPTPGPVTVTVTKNGYSLCQDGDTQTGLTASDIKRVLHAS